MSTSEGVTLNQMLHAAAQRLSGIEGASPAGDARELAQWAFGTDCLWSITEPLDAEASVRFEDAVRRRVAREPLQWITGRMHFFGCVLKARPGVFIARPETEVLVEETVAQARAVVQRCGSVTVVDLCTGSGAIALAIARHVPQAQVWAVEIDQAAFDLACENAAALELCNVNIICADATDPHTLAHLDGTVDVLTSNPPYVPYDEAPTQVEASLDPPLALFGGGARGMEVPSRIVERASRLLTDGGVMFVEHSQSQGALMRQAAQSLGLSDATTRRDLTGRDRYLRATRGKIAL